VSGEQKRSDCAMKGSKHIMPKIFSTILISLGVIAPVHASGHDLLGCWYRKAQQGKSISSLRLCFDKKGQLNGGATDWGHGYDFHGTWQRKSPGQVGMRLRNSAPILCDFSVLEQQNSLQLKQCSDESFMGVYKKIDLE
jgi:hypothetical protein